MTSQAERWLDPGIRRKSLQLADGQGLARDSVWYVGQVGSVPGLAPAVLPGIAASRQVDATLARAEAVARLDIREIANLFRARDVDAVEIASRADALRARHCGDTVSYVVTRNINYTNVCKYRCSFCAFSKGRTAERLRGKPYDISLEEVSRRAAEAHARGATEVCMQGGIHPGYDGNTYLELLQAAKAGAPDIHVHAFSPLEVTHGAETLGLPLPAYLERLAEAGLGSLPGTAAEILSDDMRKILCPDKLTTQGWLDVLEDAHGVGLKTTSTIMFGHVETYEHWAKHLLHLRDLQERGGGITEFVPLPFVHMEAPLFLHGKCRKGPTYREAILMHAVARLVLGPLIPNIQVSWVKLGPAGVRTALSAGVNDLGGTLMNESISRAAGTKWGQEMPPEGMEAIARDAGRPVRQRTTLYADAPSKQVERSFGSDDLAPMVFGMTERSIPARPEPNGTRHSMRTI